MISKITINDPTALPISWWTKAPCLKDIKEITFKPGLNVLWGKNGSGKSSVLRLIAKMFHAEAGRFSFITGSSTHDILPFKSSKNPNPAERLFGSVTIAHDGQGVMYFDPDHRPGLIGGMAGFDDHFMTEGIQSIFMKGSSGELGLNNMIKLLEGMKSGDKIVPKWERKPNQDVLNFFKPSIPDGPPTFLLDEPDRSVDIPSQFGLWKFLQNAAEKKGVQIIVASHSVFATSVNCANYIEFTNGYLEACRGTIAASRPKVRKTDERAEAKGASD